MSTRDDEKSSENHDYEPTDSEKPKKLDEQHRQDLSEEAMPENTNKDADQVGQTSVEEKQNAETVNTEQSVTTEVLPVEINANKAPESKKTEVSESKAEVSESKAEVSESKAEVSESKAEVSENKSEVSESKSDDLTFDSFADAGLNPDFLSAINKIGWEEPTPVQALSLPHSLTGRDVAGFAQTGTGKTGVFLITLGHLLLQRKNENKPQGPFAVVLTPTRELAIQIEEECSALMGPLNIKSMAIFGGMNWEGQASELAKGDIDVIIATPGRLKDYFEKKILRLDQIGLFVCDEADRMFEMGFIDDVEFFLAQINAKAQKLFFSATTNPRVKGLIFSHLNDPAYISVNPDEITPENITQHALLCSTPDKFKLLLSLLRKIQPERAIIFTNTKLTAQWLLYKLNGNGIKADAITGDLAQNKRINLIKEIKKGNTKLLIATDVASRGLHISGVTHVFNFDVPDEAANYVHRIGRTARAGEKGTSYSLLCDEYSRNFLEIQNILGKNCPEAVWPEDDFLMTEDKAGNPFLDEASPLSRDPRSDRDRPRADKRDRKDFKGRPSFDKSKRPHEQSRGPGDHRNRNSHSNRSRQDSYKKSHKGSYNKRHDQAGKNRYTSKKHSSRKVSKQKSNVSIFGILKRFFSLLFKWK